MTHSIHNAEPNEQGLFIRAILPLRSIVIYPRTLAPVSIPEGQALNAVHYALDRQQTVIGVAVRNAAATELGADDLFTFGTELALTGLHVISDGYQSALAEGRRRVEIVEVVQKTPYLLAQVRSVDETVDQPDELDLLKQTIKSMFQQMIELNDNIPDDVVNFTLGLDNAGWLADFVSSTLNVSLDERQQILEITSLDRRMHYVATLLSRELNMLELRDEINDQIQDEITRNQREIYLREQLRVIQSELGEEDFYQQDLTDLQEQIDAANLPPAVYDVAMKELNRLQMMPPMAPEVGMIHGYIDWIVALPWSNASEDNLDVRRAQEILDAEHYGLPRVKDRILEHIAVRKLAADKIKTPILCFVGPPGVGKTSLGRSIAKALGREFVRVSLGGIRDEAEIRGHRRTYIGAMPGRILQTMRRAGTINPVFMLDEIDKIGADFRGDPASALLEALDPEQNREFSDHYFDMDYDLSHVMFITTANDLYPLPPALLDRMEVIDFPGYTEEDKLAIARTFLIPRQLESHGLDTYGLQFETGALKEIIRDYTYEAGVRNFNREIGKVCRKVARLIAEEKRYPKRITARRIEDYLGPPDNMTLRANDQDSVGIVTGLAWTAGGGDILMIEVSLLPGKGSTMLTGQLGEVMQESAQIAMSYMRSRARDLDIPVDDFENYDIHIHLPEGAIPKDGPSAGITLAIAIISAFTECKVRSDYAMTGEITLRGRVLPVGGIKEKVLAAHRNHIKNVILPEQNRKDLVDVPPKALRDINIVFVEDMQSVMERVLLPPPKGGRERDKYREDEELAETDVS